MTGLAILRGLWITLKRLIMTYVEDFKGGKNRYHTPEGIEARRDYRLRGAITIQYPEEKLPVPERFRYIPFLVYDETADGERKLRCTSCGICARVCPPQCIWIVRGTDANTGKPIPTPLAFYIDVDVCMNCGMCAEFCPFDSIKMDHEYEIATYDRFAHHIFDLERLAKSSAYYARIRPTDYAAEEAVRREKAAKAAQKAES